MENENVVTEGQVGESGSQTSEQGTGEQTSIQQGQQPQEDGRFIPRERFDKVYGQFAEYKKLGKIPDLQTRLQKLDAWEKAVEEQRKRTQDANGDPEIENQLFSKVPKIKAALEKIAEFDKRFEKFGTYEQGLAELREQTISQRMDKASTYFSGELKKAYPNITLDKKDQDRMEKIIWYDLSAEQQQEFANGDFSFIDDFIVNNKDFLSRFAPAKSTPKPFVRLGSQGAPQQSEVDMKSKTMSQLGDVAWEHFRSDTS